MPLAMMVMLAIPLETAALINGTAAIAIVAMLRPLSPTRCRTNHRDAYRKHADQKTRSKTESQSAKPVVARDEHLPSHVNWPFGNCQ
jgi:hypothetical protein